MSGSFFLQGLIIGFSIAAPVGPIGILCIRRTLAEGRLTGFVSGLGAATADAVYGSIAAFGLTAGTLTLLQTSTYAGTTRVQGGTLACATTASLAPTALEIAAAAKVDLQYSGTRTIPSLALGGVVKGPGVYGMGTDPTYFTGPGTVTVQPPTPSTPTLPPGSFSIATGGVPTFSNVPTTAGYTYWLTYKNSLKDPAWTRIGTGTAGGGNKTFTDTLTPYPAQRFYRLEVQ